MPEKAVDRIRVVVRKVSLDHAVTVNLAPRLAAGRCHAGQQDAVIGPGPLQGFDERLRRARLAD